VEITARLEQVGDLLLHRFARLFHQPRQPIHGRLIVIQRKLLRDRVMRLFNPADESMQRAVRIIERELAFHRIDVGGELFAKLAVGIGQLLDASAERRLSIVQ
jgi:hypothetical protein